jgi:transposase-like protein
MSILNAKHFHEEEAAFLKLEAILWPDGPNCPHCAALDRIYALKGVRSKPSKKHPKGVVRHGLKKCGHCRKQFTVRVGTVFEDSHAPLHKWFQAIHLMASSKTGISSHQLHRTLEVQYNTAWFMSRRIREAMRAGPLSPMGSGGVVEIDETIYGRAATHPKSRRHDPKHNNRSRLGVEDKERAKKAVVGARGKRLTYKATDSARPDAGEDEDATPL